MTANPTFMFKDGTAVLVDEYVENGTIIGVVNACRAINKSFPRHLVAYYALELILIAIQIHKCAIIHGDLKPDNVLVINL